VLENLSTPSPSSLIINARDTRIRISSCEVIELEVWMDEGKYSYPVTKHEEPSYEETYYCIFE
jgi:hypothetical protein